MSTQTHLNFQDRLFLQKELTAKVSFRQMALMIGKDPTTLAKEVKRNRIQRNVGFSNSGHNDCLHRRTCSLTHVCPTCSKIYARRCSLCGQCTTSCPSFTLESCATLNQAPYVCNGCPRKNNCSLTKQVYDASVAHQMYRTQLSSARSGMNFTETELHQIDLILSPLLKQRQSIHHVITHNPDLLPYSEKTLYTCVNAGLLDARNLDLTRKVRLMPRRKTKEVKIERTCREGRSYSDFTQFLNSNAYPPVVQMDTVEGTKGGSNLLTLYFESSGLMLAFKRPLNNSRSVIDCMNSLYSTLGHADYTRLFGVLLTDNGHEFSHPSALEFNADHLRRSFVFYCDPSKPFQKGACERNHEMIRLFIPKGVDFDLFSEAQIQSMMNHINSYSRKKLNDKSPAFLFSLLESPDCLAKLGISIIPPNDIFLTDRLFSQL